MATPLRVSAVQRGNQWVGFVGRLDKPHASDERRNFVLYKFPRISNNVMA